MEWGKLPSIPVSVEKAVGSEERAVASPIGFSFDDGIFSWLQGQEGMKKPTNISFETLRKLNRTMGIANNCKTILKRRVNQTPWDIVPKDKSKANENDGEYLKHLLENPTGKNNTSFRSFIDLVV